MEIGVVHLVRACNSFEAFERFLTSYERANKEPQQELLLLFKGFDPNDPSRHGLATYQQRLQNLPYRCLFVPDAGFDITPYFIAARSFEHPYFCFLNSFSQILDPDWLVKMHPHILRPGVGIVGASGSWESSVPYIPQTRLRSRPIHRRLALILILEYKALFSARFPNHHVRTNAFLIKREIALSLQGASPRTKQEAYRFEHGRASMTKQLLKRGLQPLIVGRDGRAYSIGEWPESNIFWQGDQDNLLVADNRTEEYHRGTLAERLAMWRRAWHEQGVAPLPTNAPETPVQPQTGFVKLRG